MRSLAVWAALVSLAHADAPAHRDIHVENHYLNLPVKTGAPKKRMRYLLDGKPVREFEIELADGT